MNKTVILSSGNIYRFEDFYLDNLLRNEKLLNELEMKSLPQTFLQVFGIEFYDAYKPILKKKVELYDKSESVNSFIYKGRNYWLDKQQRSCMRTLAESGLESIEFVLDDTTITLPSTFVKQFIDALEVYAYKCFVITAKHLQAISKIDDPLEILNYNYTTGYPDKITLE